MYSTATQQVRLAASRENARIEKELKALKELSDAELKSVREKVDTASRNQVSLDIVSVLRSMQALWFNNQAKESLQSETQGEHGHGLLMALLVNEAMHQPGVLNGQTLIEIGSTREPDPAQRSTEKLAIFSAVTGMNFITVDMDPECTGNARRIVRRLNPAGQAVTKKGEDYLAAFPGPLDYVYLDAFDYDHGMHSQERQARYRDILKAEITNEMAWEMHSKCAESIISKMREGGIVVVDDTWLDADGKDDGKGKLAVPLLLENGFEIVARTSTAVALKRVST
jgi:hypothetical protein